MKSQNLVSCLLYAILPLKSDNFNLKNLLFNADNLIKYLNYTRFNPNINENFNLKNFFYYIK